MQSVIVTFEGTEQNAHDLISNMPQAVANVGGTFVDAKRAVEASAEEVLAVEESTENAQVADEVVTGSQPEEPKPGFLGEPSEAEKTMEKE